MVPIPTDMVEPTETEKSAEPITRSRVRELAHADTVPLKAEQEIKSKKPQGESKEEVGNAEATSCQKTEKGSPRVSPQEAELSVITEEATSDVKDELSRAKREEISSPLFVSALHGKDGAFRDCHCSRLDGFWNPCCSSTTSSGMGSELHGMGTELLQRIIS